MRTWWKDSPAERGEWDSDGPRLKRKLPVAPESMSAAIPSNYSQRTFSPRNVLATLPRLTQNCQCTHLRFVQAQHYRVALESRAIRKLNHKSEMVRIRLRGLEAFMRWVVVITSNTSPTLSLMQLLFDSDFFTLLEKICEANVR